MATSREMVLIEPIQYETTWRIYSPTRGCDVARGFESYKVALQMAQKFGYEVGDKEAFDNYERLEIDGNSSYGNLRWWIRNNHLRAVREGYADLLLYEAGSAYEGKLGNELRASLYDGLAVGVSEILELIARDYDHYYPAYMWTTLAKHENEQAKAAGKERVTTANGSIELV